MMMFAPTGVPYGAAYGDLIKDEATGKLAAVKVHGVVPVALWMLQMRTEESPLLAPQKSEGNAQIVVTGLVPHGPRMVPATTVGGFLGYVPLDECPSPFGVLEEAYGVTVFEPDSPEPTKQ